MQNLPSPSNLAKAIANTSFSDIDKRLMLLKIRTLNKDEIITFYESLLNLNLVEENFAKAVRALDTKYQMKFHEAYADTLEKNLEPKQG